MWMNHWKNTNSNSARHSLYDERRKDHEMEQGERIVQIGEHIKHKMFDINAAPCNISEYRNSWEYQRDDSFIASTVPQSMKAIEVVTEAQRFQITYETLVTNSRNTRDAGLELQPISVCNFSEKTGSIFTQKRLAVPVADGSNTQTNDIPKYGATSKPSNFHGLFKALRSAALDESSRHNEPANKMCDFTFNKLLPIHSHSGLETRLEESNNGCQSSPAVPQPHRIDNLILPGSVGSLHHVSDDLKFSPETGHMCITDLSLGKHISREHISRASTVSTKFKESVSERPFTLLSDFNRDDDECSEKFQPLQCSKNIEEKKQVKNERAAFVASKNESSAETETMDVNVFQTWNSPSSTTSSPSCKDNVVCKTPAISQSRILREKLRGKKTGIELPDMNREPPSSLLAEKETSNMDWSTSRTESLDVEHLVIDHAANSNSSAQHVSSPSPDPSSRWVKRLKLSSSGHHPHGTKSVTIEDPSCTAKVDKLQNTTDCIKTSLRLASNKFFDEEMGQKLENTPLSIGNNKLASTYSIEEWRLNLSHPWIQRWCHNQAPQPQENSLAPVACELSSSKAALDEYQTRQFPSIAAMALMGKTMNGLQACMFQNKGSFVVWGAGEFGEHSAAPRSAGD